MKKVLFTVVVVALISLTQNAFAGSYVGVMKGTIKGAYVTFKDNVTADEIYIKTGHGECNGNYFEIPSDITYELTSISGEDFYYIYIDDSADSYPVLDSAGDFIHSTTEPSWSDTKQGWYNGDDRCIGVVWVDSGNNLAEFSNNSANEYFTVSDNLKHVVNDGTPTTGWSTLETTNYIPKNAISVYVAMNVLDNDGVVSIGISPAENTYQNLGAYAYKGASTLGWLSLEKGWSRDLKWFASNDDDTLNIWIKGFKIER